MILKKRWYERREICSALFIFELNETCQEGERVLFQNIFSHDRQNQSRQISVKKNVPNENKFKGRSAKVAELNFDMHSLSHIEL